MLFVWLQTTAHVAKLDMDPNLAVSWMLVEEGQQMVHSLPEHPEAAFR